MKTEAFGGSHVTVRLTGDYFDDTLAAAQSYCEEVAGHFLSPFDDADVIEGQASVGVEMETQLEGAPDLIIMPVGGGGLASGVSSYFGSSCDYLLVEPTGGACLAAAFRAGHPTKLPQIDTFADGAAVAMIGTKTFDRLKRLGESVTRQVDENRLCTTMIDMLNVEGFVLEPAGALAIDVLKDIKDEVKGKRVVAVASGGNFDFERLPEVRERALRSSGIKKYFILRLPQRPGALKDFLGMLGPDDDISRFEYLKKSARNFGSILIGIETANPDNFARIENEMSEAGYNFRDITNDDILAQFLI